MPAPRFAGGLSVSDSDVGAHPALKPGHAACLGCAFATNGDPERPRRQTGCALGRTDAFRERGELIEAEDGENEFFVVNRPCNARRTREWLANHDDPIDRVLTETAVRVSLIVPFMPGHHLDDLVRTLRWANDQAMPFSEAFVVNAQSAVSLEEIKGLTSKVYEAIPFRTTHLFRGADWEEAVDEVVPKTSGDYYMVFFPGTAIPDDCVARLNMTVNWEMRPIIAVRPHRLQNGTTVLRRFHVSPDVLGNHSLLVPDGDEDVEIRSVVAKAERFARINGAEDVVVDWEGLWNAW